MSIKGFTVDGQDYQYNYPNLDNKPDLTPEAIGAASQEDFDALEEKVTQQNTDILNAFPVDSVSGPIVAFPDGADELPIKAGTIHVEPVQDLHGYDNPWPAGGGANIYSGEYTPSKGLIATTGEIQNAASNISVTGKIPVSPATDYYFYVFGLGSSSYGLAWYDANDAYISGVVFSMSTSTPVGVRKSPSNAAYCRFTVLTENVEKVSVNYPATVTEFRPYSNICPISGWTQANVEQRNKNLCPHFATRQSAGITWTVDEETGAMSVSGVATGNANNYQETGQTAATSIINLKNGDYVVSGGYNNSIYLVIIDGANGEGGTRTDVRSEERQITVTKGFVTVRYVCLAGTVVPDGLVLYPMIRPASFSDSAFEPYTPRAYPITFPSSAGTVFGAEIDLVAKKMAVNRAEIQSYNGETLPGEWISDRDVYSAGGTPTIGAQVVYVLATPIVYDLTDEQITEITTYLGNNTMWADCGDIDLTYRADPTEYISKKLAEIQALVLENNG